MIESFTFVPDIDAPVPRPPSHGGGVVVIPTLKQLHLGVGPRKPQLLELRDL